MASDYRDRVIEMVTDHEAMLNERIVSLETDVAVYRELTCTAFDALHALTVKHQSLQHTKNALVDEFRAFREQIMLSAGVEDTERVTT